MCFFLNADTNKSLGSTHITRNYPFQCEFAYDFFAKEDSPKYGFSPMCVCICCFKHDFLSKANRHVMQDLACLSRVSAYILTNAYGI